MRRVIRPFPRKGIHQTPAGAWLVDGTLDYVTDAEPPNDAVYVAEMDDKGNVAERVNKLNPGQAHRHQREGWPQPRGKAK